MNKTTKSRRAAIAARLCTALFAATALVPVVAYAQNAGVPAAAARTFAPYIDMGLTADEHLVAIRQASHIPVFTLAFIASVPGGGCVAGWSEAGSYTSDTLADGSTIKQQVQAVRAHGGNVIISFGGQAGDEPALNCTTVASLQALYQGAINRYKATSLDFDIEGTEVENSAANKLRDQTLKQIRKKNPGIKLSYTLQVLPTGLDGDGVAVLHQAKKDGFTPDVINVMAMDYGSSFDPAKMGNDAITAAEGTRKQIAAAKLTSKVGVTVMIGDNDDAAELFSLANAKQVLKYVQGHDYIERLSMWSVGRDNGSCPGQRPGTYSCSGIKQSTYEFSKIFDAFGKN